MDGQAGERQKDKSHSRFPASLLPAANYSWRPELKNSTEKIKELNRWLKEFAAEEKIEFVDYFAVMSDKDGAMRKEFAEDGVHPNATGYAAMQPLALKALKFK